MVATHGCIKVGHGTDAAGNPRMLRETRFSWTKTRSGRSPFSRGGEVFLPDRENNSQLDSFFCQESPGFPVGFSSKSPENLKA